MSGHHDDRATGETHRDDQAPDTAEAYDPAEDPDADPEMLTSKHPAQQGENRRDPAEGPDDESATDG